MSTLQAPIDLDTPACPGLTYTGSDVTEEPIAKQTPHMPILQQLDASKKLTKQDSDLLDDLLASPIW